VAPCRKEYLIQTALVEMWEPPCNLVLGGNSATQLRERMEEEWLSELLGSNLRHLPDARLDAEPVGLLIWGHGLIGFAIDFRHHPLPVLHMAVRK
jgi:hypothetical protein